MRNFSVVGLLCLILFCITGCATLFGGGSDEKLTVESSEPLKIKVIGSDGQVINKSTPFSIQIERSQNYTVKVQSDNYQSDDVYIGRKVRTLAILNLFCLFCWAIDLATGNVWEHKIHHVYIDTKDLERKKAMGLPSFDSLISLHIVGNDPTKEFAESKLSGTIHFNRMENN